MSGARTEAEQVAAYVQGMWRVSRREAVARAADHMAEALYTGTFTMAEGLLALGTLLGHLVAANQVETPLPLQAVLSVAQLAESQARQLDQPVISIGPAIWSRQQ
ncbi:hypothetical protein UFOVP99_10 [uncultured Caudovirales phage]|uniref:Uncharacterized protein n=1 Tax=uncultured Caudovirales phage TaxID=2100421 RepID=A0A6J5L486_9CAUD|nr:hypothetical protein UFOVP99_10 [uncultured Caudovirales phage]